MLAGSIALTASFLIALIERLTLSSAISVFLISFSVCFPILFLALESLVFRKLRNLSDLVKKWREKTDAETNSPAGHRPDLLQKIGEDIAAVVEEKQREINTLRKLEAFRKDFIADVSHELKTPIFAAQGFVHTLLDGAVKEKAVRKKFLKKAAKSLDGLDILVQDLLTLSHIETGQIRMRFQEIDLYALTADVFDQFRGKSNKKEIALRIEGPARKVLVYADWQRITQVMTNLISNAIKHSDAAGEVVVSFAVRKKSVITRVRDHGEGIPPEHIGRIFERFYRVDKSRSREKGGTGLGLAIVKHILEGHNSVPEVESAPGIGSTFSFRLPRSGQEKIKDGQDQQPDTD